MLIYQSRHCSAHLPIIPLDCTSSRRTAYQGERDLVWQGRPQANRELRDVDSHIRASMFGLRTWNLHPGQALAGAPGLFGF